MFNDQLLDPSNVLVELSVVPLGGNGQIKEQVAKVVDIVDKAGLFHQRTRTGTCIEGKWKDISGIIYSCYERVQEVTPQGFLRVSIR
jgi:uncharacterized protein YqgV (UPF0045/DUF77 family)